MRDIQTNRNDWIRSHRIRRNTRNRDNRRNSSSSIIRDRIGGVIRKCNRIATRVLHYITCELRTTAWANSIIIRYIDRWPLQSNTFGISTSVFCVINSIAASRQTTWAKGASRGIGNAWAGPRPSCRRASDQSNRSRVDTYSSVIACRSALYTSGRKIICHCIIREIVNHQIVCPSGYQTRSRNGLRTRPRARSPTWQIRDRGQ